MITRETFTYDSRDEKKTKIHAVKWIPERDKPICVVQILHGMAEHMERYDEFARFLAEQGILVVGNDHLGHGKTVSENDGVYGYFCEQDPATVVVRDVHRLKKIIQEENLGVPYILMGHSMGSFMVRDYLTRYGTGIDGAIILSTGDNSNAMLSLGKFLAGMEGLIHKQTHKSGFLNAIVFGSYLKRIPEKRTTIDWFTNDTDVIDKYLEDKQCGFTFTINGFKTVFELSKRCNDKKALNKIPKKLPVLIAAGTEDPVGNYGVAPQKVYDTYLNLDMTKVQLKMYKGARHELVNETNRESICKDLLNWILAVSNN